jgi:Tfp pilus assembly protein PilN
MIKINLLGVPKAKKGKRAAAAAAAVSGEGPSPILMLIVGVVVTVVLLGLWYLMLDRDQKRLQADLAAAQRKKQELAVIETKVKQKEQIRDGFERRVKVIADLEAKRSGPVDLLAMMSNTVNQTDAVWLDSMTDDGARINLSGQALDVHALANLMGNLQRTGYFKDVQLKQTQQQDDKDVQAFSFVLICDKKTS